MRITAYDPPSQLLTDRGAYLNFLEVQLERVSAACLGVEAYDGRLSDIQGVLTSLEERSNNATRLVSLSQQCVEEVRVEILTKIEAALGNFQEIRSYTEKVHQQNSVWLNTQDNRLGMIEDKLAILPTLDINGGKCNENLSKLMDRVELLEKSNRTLHEEVNSLRTELSKRSFEDSHKDVRTNTTLKNLDMKVEDIVFSVKHDFNTAISSKLDDFSRRVDSRLQEKDAKIKNIENGFVRECNALNNEILRINTDTLPKKSSETFQSESSLGFETTLLVRNIERKLEKELMDLEKRQKGHVDQLFERGEELDLKLASLEDNYEQMEENQLLFVGKLEGIYKAQNSLRFYRAKQASKKQTHTTKTTQKQPNNSSGSRREDHSLSPSKDDGERPSLSFSTRNNTNSTEAGSRSLDSHRKPIYADKKSEELNLLKKLIILAPENKGEDIIDLLKNIYSEKPSTYETLAKSSSASVSADPSNKRTLSPHRLGGHNSFEASAHSFTSRSKDSGYPTSSSTEFNVASDGKLKAGGFTEQQKLSSFGREQRGNKTWILTQELKSLVDGARAAAQNSVRSDHSDGYDDRRRRVEKDARARTGRGLRHGVKSAQLRSRLRRLNLLPVDPSRPAWKRIRTFRSRGTRDSKEIPGDEDEERSANILFDDRPVMTAAEVLALQQQRSDMRHTCAPHASSMEV